MRLDIRAYSILLLCFGYVYASADSIEIRNHLQEALKVVYSSPPDALQKIQKALAHSKGEVHPFSEADCYNHLGIYYDVIGNNDSALVCYNYALHLLNDYPNNRLYAGISSNIGLIYWNKEVLDSALQFLSQAANIYEKLGNKKGYANVLNNMALIYKRDYRADVAITYFKESLAIRIEINDSSGIGISHANLGMMYDIGKFSDSARAHYLMALPFFKNNHRGLSTLHHNLASSYKKSKNYDIAREHALKALDYRNALGHQKQIAETLRVLGRIEFDDQNYKASEEHYKNALTYYQNVHHLKGEVGILRLQTELYIKTNQSQKAAAVYAAFNNLSDSLMAIQKNDALLTIQTEFETERTKREAAEARLTAELSEKQKTRWISISIFLFMLAIGLYVYWRNRLNISRNKKKQELLEQKLEISKELHDNIGSQLTYIHMGIDGLSKAPLDEKMRAKSTELKSFSKKTISDLRGTVWGLNKSLTAQDLGAKIASELKLLNNAQIQTRTQIETDETTLNSALAINCLRIAQEAFQNILKHANATEVDVKFNSFNGRISLQIKDDGVGIKQEQLTTGFGLKYMKQRAEKNGMKIEYGIPTGGGHQINLSYN